MQFIKHHSIKTYGGMEVWPHALLMTAVNGGKWPASRPSRFTPRKEPLVSTERKLGGRLSTSRRLWERRYASHTSNARIIDEGIDLEGNYYSGNSAEREKIHGNLTHGSSSPG
jgi:hypothetical protein